MICVYTPKSKRPALYRYIISRNIETDSKKYIRKAEDAEQAIDKLCNQYGWNYKLDMYDADTRGLEWAKCNVDTNGGTEWNRTLIATKIEKE